MRRQAWILYHGKPRLDGASGFTSNRYAAFRRDMQAFPAPETSRRAFEKGARRLVVASDCRPAGEAGHRVPA